MKRLLTILIVSNAQLMLSCNTVDNAKPLIAQTKEKSTPVNTKLKTDEVFILNADDILKDFMTWYTYTHNNIRLAQDFTGLDTDSGKLNKDEFLNRLSTGSFVPFKIRIQNNLPIYKLRRINGSIADIQSTIKQMALNEKFYYKMEGTQLPDYNFTDLTGKTYDKSTTKGKILVIKCWFIQCVPCVQEFPQLNKIVSKYTGRHDILFVSLAMNSRQDLLSFLKTKKFNYAVVPDMEKYMSEQIGTTQYPTHILVDKNGKIKKVVNAIEDLVPFLEKQTQI